MTAVIPVSAGREAGSAVRAPLAPVVGADTCVPLITGDAVRYTNLDYAASAPALTAVADVVARSLGDYASVHRGAGYLSQVTTERYESARETVRRFVRGRTDDTVVFTRNTTDAINLAAHITPGDVVVLDIEHHANLLPWCAPRDGRNRARVVPACDTIEDTLVALEAELASAPDLAAASAMLANVDFGLYSEAFLAPRPLLDAILSEDPVVLLVDEVDRTEESMEALLLEVLAEKQVTVPEVGTFTARTAPWVVLTSNDTRELSGALKRRCLHLTVDFPTAEIEREIVSSRAPDVEEGVIADVVDLARSLRDLPLRKAPSVSEVIDAARAAMLLGDTASAATRETLYSVLLKYASDTELVRARATAPAAPPAPERTVVPSIASAPPNSTTAAFRGRGGRS